MTGWSKGQRATHGEARAALQGLRGRGMTANLAGGGSDGQHLHVDVPLEGGHVVSVRPNSDPSPEWRNHWDLSVHRAGTKDVNGMVKFPTGANRTSATGNENHPFGASFPSRPEDLPTHLGEFLSHPDVRSAMRADQQKMRNLNRSQFG